MLVVPASVLCDLSHLLLLQVVCGWAMPHLVDYFVVCGLHREELELDTLPSECSVWLIIDFTVSSASLSWCKGRSRGTDIGFRTMLSTVTSGSQHSTAVKQACILHLVPWRVQPRIVLFFSINIIHIPLLICWITFWLPRCHYMQQ